MTGFVASEELADVVVFPDELEVIYFFGAADGEDYAIFGGFDEGLLFFGNFLCLFEEAVDLTV